jgi:hypothetical protein
VGKADVYHSYLLCDPMRMHTIPQNLGIQLPQLAMLLLHLLAPLLASKDVTTIIDRGSRVTLQVKNPNLIHSVYW